jgi:hypothetical protein
MIPHNIELIGAAKGNDIGCSVLSLAKLGQQKGYSLIACIDWNAFFVRREYAHLFADADDLDALFDPKYIRYAMQSYTARFSSLALLCKIISRIFRHYWPIGRHAAIHDKADPLAVRTKGEASVARASASKPLIQVNMRRFNVKNMGLMGRPRKKAPAKKVRKPNSSDQQRLLLIQQYIDGLKEFIRKLRKHLH